MVVGAGEQAQQQSAVTEHIGGERRPVGDEVPGGVDPGGAEVVRVGGGGMSHGGAVGGAGQQPRARRRCAHARRLEELARRRRGEHPEVGAAVGGEIGAPARIGEQRAAVPAR